MVTCSDYIIFNAVTSTRGHRWSPASTIYFCGRFCVIGTSRNGNPRHNSGGARTLFFFVFVVFVFFTVVLNKD